MDGAARPDDHRDDSPDVRTRRPNEQRWLLDARIRQLGVDGEQGRGGHLGRVTEQPFLVRR